MKTFNFDELERAAKELEQVISRVKRSTALIQMSLSDNPYRSLIRVMSKLGLIGDSGLLK